MRRYHCIAFLLLTCMLWGCRKRDQGQADQLPGDEPAVKILYPAAPGSFVKLVERLKPSVVRLSTDVSVSGGPADWLPTASTGDVISTGVLGQDMRRSLGTGFIIGRKGLVLTNAHVVQRASTLLVHLGRKAPLKAKLLGQDLNSDVALLRFTPPAGARLTPVRLGNSDHLRAGEWVVALGNPFGHGITVNAGVVSSRQLTDLAPGKRGLWAFIQTDVAIHPGNSGGPLVNMHGEVVGIATAVDSGVSTIGFAVPINLARKVQVLLQREGKVVRTWVGVYMDYVTPEKAKAVGLPKARGAIITSVLPRGPAEKAGLRKGDIILSFDGKPIIDAAEMPRLAALAGVNRQVAVQVWRDRKMLNFTLRPAPMPK